jgi:pyruvate,water dikinase
MVRSDLAGSGVMFSLDTESGFPNAILINAAWGLGETVVQGAVDPDEYVVFKPLLENPELSPILTASIGSKKRKMVYARGGQKTVKTVQTTAAERHGRVLNDAEVLELARWAVAIEQHYGKPMDMEWAKDGETGELYIVQARPETVQSRKTGETIMTYKVSNPPPPIVSGAAVGDSVATGTVCRIEHHDEMSRFQSGQILVAPMTDPDWVPLMKQASAIVTDQGGRTCHAAIVSRELGIPAVIGTGEATHHLGNGDVVTVDCSSGDQGHVYPGEVPFTTEELDLSGIGETKTKVMLNVGTPGAAFSFWRLPADGIGLARMEFIISNHVRVHPMALIHPDRVSSVKDSAEIDRLTFEYDDKPRYFIDKLAEGIARIAASRYPQPVIVRMSDFKTNEYADLVGGAEFEPTESNPMIGFRGASRYYDEAYREGFGLECVAIRKVREEIGLDNVVVMIPFCRTLEEADKVLAVMAENGLERGKLGLRVYVMAEIPANVILAAEFASRFDGFSIGSNDLTQLLLGVDRDSERLAAVFDERNEAVTRMIRSLIETAHANGATVGFCGQAPSDHPGYAEFLVQAGIDSISVTPDVLVDVKRRVAAEEEA